MRRAAAILAGGLVLAALLGACGSNDQAKQAVLSAIARSLASPRHFVYVDQDLDHRTSVSGELDDALRYEMLLSVDGRPQWQVVVHDDGVADLFPRGTDVARYVGKGWAPQVDVLADVAAIRPLLPKSLPAPSYASLPPLVAAAAPASGAVSALEAGRWVLDPTGAPPPATLAEPSSVVNGDPFYAPEVMLQGVAAEVTDLQANQVVRFEPGSLTPTYKATDDPFPPPGRGIVRYDIAEPSLPPPGPPTASGTPPAPDSSYFEKTAVYVAGGRVVEVAENWDVLDRLQQLVKMYRVPLRIDRQAGPSVEERLGQLIVETLQGATATVPFRVHSETMLIRYAKSPPRISLPSQAVVANLSVLPGQGAAAQS